MSRTKTNDVSQTPPAMQFNLGATTSEAKLAAEIEQSPIPDPGAIVDRLSNQQWQMPRADIPKASPDATISRDMH